MPKFSSKLAAVLLTAAILAGLIIASCDLWSANAEANEAASWLLLPFFLLIGIELRREFGASRSSAKRLVAPLLSAVLGAALPALTVFVLLPNASAWPVPVATDLTLSLAIFGLATRGVPSHWRTYLLAFAVFDDVFAIIALNASHAGWSPSLLGVGLGLLVPAKPGVRLERILLAPVNYVLVPAFAFVASAFGLNLALGGLIFLAIAARPIGKFLGIVGGYALARAARLEIPREGAAIWISGLGLLGGIGFTVAFSAANQVLASDATALANAKAATLFAGVLSAAGGYVLLRRATRGTSSPQS